MLCLYHGVFLKGEVNCSQSLLRNVCSISTTQQTQKNTKCPKPPQVITVITITKGRVPRPRQVAVSHIEAELCAALHAALATTGATGDHGGYALCGACEATEELLELCERVREHPEKGREPLVASLPLVAMPFAPSSVLVPIVVWPGAPSSILVPRTGSEWICEVGASLVGQVGWGIHGQVFNGPKNRIQLEHMDPVRKGRLPVSQLGSRQEDERTVARIEVSAPDCRDDTWDAVM